MRRRVLAVGLIATAVVLGGLTNVADQRLEPFGATSVTGQMGEDVLVHPFTVHVNSARAAETLTVTSSFDEATSIGSDGVWVVVNLSYASTETASSPGSDDLVLMDAEGREFPLSSRANGKDWLAGPDVWVRGELAFEVAAGSVDDLTLVFDPVRKFYGPMPMRYLTLPLGLDSASVAETTELAPVELLDEGER